MPQIVWDPSVMSVGHPLIDEQHIKLLELLNKMSTALEVASSDPNFVKQVLQELCDYTVNHFNMEEDLMDPEAYPEYDTHVTEHMECTQAVLDFLQDFSEKSEGDLRAFSDFATTWVVNHVLGTDKTLGRFLAGN